MTETDVQFVESILLTDPANCAVLAEQLLGQTALTDAQRARMLRCAGLACFESGRIDEAHPFLEEGMRLARDCGLGLVELGCLNGMAVSMHRLGRYQAALGKFTELLHQPSIRGFPRMYAIGLTNLGTLYEDLGNFAEALSLHEQAAQNVPGGETAMPALTLNIASVLTAMGRPRDAIDRLRPAMDAADRDRETSTRAHVLAETGRAQTDLGLFLQAQASLETAVGLSRQFALNQELCLALGYRARLLLKRREIAAAAIDAEESAFIARRMKQFSYLRSALAVLTRVKQEEGMVGEQLAAMTELEALSEKMLGQHAGLLVPSRSIVEARAPEASKRFPQTSDLLGRLNAGERRVLDQLVKGLTNKMIAQRLGISHHTVRHQISNITAKLGVRNRTEVARLAFAGGWIESQANHG